MRAKLNPRLAKIHRSYSVTEIARLYGIHKNTVTRWVKSGLPTVDSRRPYLILGGELAAFLRARLLGARRPCGLGELFCLRCRVPRLPRDGLVTYEPQTPLLGNLSGTCSVCGAGVNRRTSAAKVQVLSRVLHITMPPGLLHICPSPSPSLNGDFQGVSENA